MAVSQNEWIRTAWDSEHWKNKHQLRRKHRKQSKRVLEKVKFKMGYVQWENKRNGKWKIAWTKQKKILKEGLQKYQK